MTIRVALHHETTYQYDRRISLGPQVIRLRPAPHCRTPITSYSLRVEPANHFLNWVQDPFSNYAARAVFNEKVDRLKVSVDVVADMTVINPFEFFLEPNAEEFPFSYSPTVSSDLKPFLEIEESGPLLLEFLTQVDLTPRRTIDFLVDLNRLVQQAINYSIRMEPGVQTCEETLGSRNGSCRDSGWLLVQILRHLGLAARFASGYLIQLKPDVKSLDGPSGSEVDFTDLHAWTEVYLPGAGWIGLDPTSGLLAGEGHIPLACTPHPHGAAPVSGSHEKCESEFAFSMSIARVHEDPRVTKPYTEEQWARIDALGQEVDQRLERGDVRLTMGGEPTFVSIDDMDGIEWQTAAVGPTKQRLADGLMRRLQGRFAPGGLLHFGQGKWYPGESLPRWSMQCYWRTDGQPIWNNPELFAQLDVNYGHNVDDAQLFARKLARRLGVQPDHVIDGYEDVMYYMWKERRLPANVDVRDNRLENEEERTRVARVFEQGVTSPVGVVLPLQYRWWMPEPKWYSGLWQVRSDEMFLIPGDSPMGFRLPLQALVYLNAPDYPIDYFPRDPFELHPDLPDYARLRDQLRLRAGLGASLPAMVGSPIPQYQKHDDPHEDFRHDPQGEWSYGGGLGNGRTGNGQHRPSDDHRDELAEAENHFAAEQLSDIVRTALCVEPRNGKLHLFLPPIDYLEHFLDLIAAIEDTSESLDMPVVIEGYTPPSDPRLEHLKVTPDPGVIEVNVHPAHNWTELVDITSGVYEDAHCSRLGTEKFDLDGTHTGTGGGNHVVIGGATPADSPFLRRPDLIRSLLAYWINHPSLSYLFSGRFIGPTSQAPRVDEGRVDALYELQIAFDQIPEQGPVPPWLVDRIFRHLLTDLTGNTHRSEFCIDKLFSPDTSSGRLGLVEFRAFEMPPHAKMSLTQQLLLRSLIARFWETPYNERLVSWGTSLHDRFLLPHFVWNDFQDVIAETNVAGFGLDLEWFAPHFEFRFPKIGELSHRNVHLELRQAIEPWYVLGEEPAGGATARFVDSSVERMQVLVRGLTDTRHLILCNGRRLPLHPTGTEGEFVAGIRYRAWQPPSCLHPTIGVHEPLVFDVLDRWMKRSLGGCRYHVGHPGGLNPSTFPVNAYEAESRRATRFSRLGHSPGMMPIPAEENSPRSPMTLDLRRS